MPSWKSACPSSLVSEPAPGMLSASPSAGLQVRTLLVPLDGTPLAELALPVALRLVATAGAELVLVRVVAALERRRKLVSTSRPSRLTWRRMGLPPQWPSAVASWRRQSWPKAATAAWTWC